MLQTYRRINIKFSKSVSIASNSNIQLLRISAIQDDSEDKNLSWLYNFKLNELPHLSPEVNRTRTETAMRVDEIIQEATANEVEETDIVVGENIVIENAPKM